MGRRPAAYREKPRTRIIWTRAATIDLLSNHEIVVERLPQNGGRNRSAKDEVLHRLQSILKKRTKGQINSKLLHLWKVSTDEESRGEFSDVYRVGISCMTRLDDRLKKEVQERLHVIRTQEMLDFIKSPRTTRSASRHPRDETSRSIRSQMPPVDCTPSKSMGQRQCTKLRHRAFSSSESQPLPQKNLTTEETNSIRRSSTLSQLVAMPTGTSIADTESDIKSSQSFRTRTEGSDSNSTFTEFPDMYSDSQSLSYMDTMPNGPAIDYDDHESMRRFPEIPIQNPSLDTLQDLFNDNVYFRDKWSAAAEECRRLQDQNRIRYSQQSMTTAAKDLKAIDTTNKVPGLQHNIGISKLLEPFRKLGEGTHGPSIVKEVECLHEKMQREFRCLLTIEGLHSSVDGAMSRESEDFRELKWRVFSDSDPSWPLDDTSHHVGLVIQSFTGAAVCEWVFRAELRCAAMMDIPLHGKCKELLRAICGDDALRNLDFMAHQSLISDDHFQTKFIPRTAGKLAKRLLNELSPFITFERPQERAEFEDQLELIFEFALKIKFLVMTSIAMFDFIWPARNEVFEKDVMAEPKKTLEAGRDHSKQKVKKVEFVLVPGLCVYSNEKASVDYSGFIRGNEEGLSKPNVVAHAVVTVK